MSGKTRYIQDGSFWRVKTFNVGNGTIELPSKFVGDLCPSTLVNTWSDTNTFKIGIKHPINDELEICRTLFLSYFMPQLDCLGELNLHDLCSVYAFIDAYFIPSDEDLETYTKNLKAHVLKLIRDVQFLERSIYRYLLSEAIFGTSFPTCDGVCLMEDIIQKIEMKGVISTKHGTKSSYVLEHRYRPGDIGIVIIRLIKVFGVFRGNYPELMITIMKLAGISEELIELLE